MNKHPLALVASAALAALGLSAAAQDGKSLSAAAQDGKSLSEVTVTGNPLGSTERITPVTRLEGTPLLLQRKPSLGETLGQEPGVSSTYFGPAASRPVIRGLDGDRIRILGNGTGTADVSGLSFDHAVSADPIAVERIEVLRGPAALMYGGSAVGGVVNLIDNRIPQAPLDGPLGRADVGYATGAREKSGAVLLETGNERIGLHVDAYRRTAGDVRVPLALDCTAGGTTTTASRLCNSSADSNGGAVGASVFLPQGRIGASLSEHRSDYGSPAEDEVRIGMRQRRLALEGEWTPRRAGIESVKGQLSGTHYEHTEFDEGEPGTEFRNRAREGRLELRHAPLGPVRGVLGLQAESGRFSADGDEAFAPYSRTTSTALFLHEELPTSWGRLDLGLRSEQVRVRSLGNPDVDRFTPGERRFDPASLALGALWRVAPGWDLTGHWARTQRAPRDYELFANGPHVATGAWEIGNADLGTERSTQLDVGLGWKEGRHSAQFNAYTRRFANYVALLETGLLRDEEGAGAGTGVTDCGDGTSVESGCTAGVLPEYAYRAVRARFNGLEASGNWRLATGTPNLDLQWRADRVRARDLDSGEPLPRIAPWRAGATLVLAQLPWSLRVGFDHHAAQSRVPTGQNPTGAYTLWHLGATWRAKAGPSTLTWYARVDNLTDKLAYSASSLLTQTAPGRVPLPGRSVKVGLQADF